MKQSICRLASTIIIGLSTSAQAASTVDQYKARIESLIQREEQKIKNENNRNQAIQELKKSRNQTTAKNEKALKEFIKKRPSRVNREESQSYAEYEKQQSIRSQRRLTEEKKYATQHKRVEKYQKQVESWVDPIEYDIKPSQRKTTPSQLAPAESEETINYDSDPSGF